MAGWYDPLREIESLGSQADRPGSLAGLHDARRAHMGQFFTPDAVARYMWALAEPAMARAIQKAGDGHQVSLFDNSVGSGRLLQYATPERHTLAGVDVHEPTIAQVMSTAEAAGFICSFIACGMQAARPRGFGVGLINPPFSLHLDSPLLEAYPCTTWGRFGPNTSALSHAYALAQALDACQIVIALLPLTYAAEVAANPAEHLGEEQAERLRAMIELPAGAFREEGTEVRTALLVLGYSTEKGQVVRLKVASVDETAPDLGLYCRADSVNSRLVEAGFEDEGPAITLPVTGERTVRLVHDGRWIAMRFECGLTQAKVMNAVMSERIEAYQADGTATHRYPRDVHYTGQARLDVEAHLAQKDPLASFDKLLARISEAGGVPQVDPGLRGYLARRARQVRREMTPFRHVVWTDSAAKGEKITGRARKTHMADAKVWGAPVIKAGQTVEFLPIDGGLFSYRVNSREYRLSLDEVRQRFELDSNVEAGWQVIHEGLPAAFPEMERGLRARAIALGMDKWLWAYQLDDAIECCMAPRGGIIAWKQALGKGRLSAALVLLSGVKHGLVVVEAYLVPEMVNELRGLPIPADSWQVIDSPEQLGELRTINVISYERLRRAVDPAHPRMTYGKRLRRRIGLMVADEGDALANIETQQSRAAWAVSARRRFILTGSPIANYPRDTLPLMAFACGDGTAAQPYGYRRAFMEERLVTSMAWADRGIDRFRNTFCSFEWVTHEFAESMTDGAKREIPKIANLSEYRTAIAPHVKRRLPQEPEVAKYVRIRDPKEIVTEIEWDDDHLGFYLETAEDFAEWYRNAHKTKGKNVNLVAILARIGAVTMAANYPQHGINGIGIHSPLTSKQRYAIDRLQQLTEEGHKTILFAHNPGLLDLLASELAARGVDSVVFHGQRSITERTRELNERYRYGDCPNLLASYGVAKRGLNLFQADYALMYDRDWSWTAEDQAIRRLCRPQQTNDVIAERVHIKGSIDYYQDQMVAFKREASDCGLDWATPELDDVEFLHLDTLLGRFIEDLAKLHGVQARDLREVLTANKRRVKRAA